MPWGTRGIVSLREEFVQLAIKPDSNISSLCRGFKISRKTGYKWLARAAGLTGTPLQNQSRRPHSSPARTAAQIEQRVVELRRERPYWGGRKLRRVLEDSGLSPLPAPSTITGILHRNGMIAADESQKHSAFERFERATPNELWQMDFKGHFAIDSGRCHALTILDDHSRYALGLFACANERGVTVREKLETVFRLYGLPLAILCDNGSPWGTSGADERHTELTVWLLQVGVRVLHGRPYHPQTQGKDERFHRTLQTEVLQQRFENLPHCQTRFDVWRPDYNWVRPHQALNLDVPGKHYQRSRREYSETLPLADYSGAGVEVRKVDQNGSIALWGENWKIGKAFAGQRVAIEPTPADGVYHVLFHGSVIKKLDRTSAQ